MLTALYGMAAAIAVLFAIHGAVHLRRDRASARVMPILCMITAAAALTLGAVDPASLQFRAAAWAIAWTGAVLGLLATWIFLSVLAAVTGDTERQPALLAMPVFGAASAGILQLALRKVPGARMEPGLPFLAGELVLLTYYCPALWRIAGLAWRCARRMKVRHIKVGMWVVSWAAAADFALVMLRLSAIVERASGIQIARPEITAMNAVQAVLVIHLIGGATTSAWVPASAVLFRRCLLWCTYWRLRPLWAILRRTAPQVELPPQPGTCFKIHYRLHRRVIEIRDAQLTLRPFWRQDISERTRTAAQAAGLSTQERDAAVEAAVTLAAINSHLHGIPPSVNQVAPSHTGAALSNDLQAETAHLIRVAHAMKHWPSVPGLGQPSVLERTIRRRASHLPVRLIARIWRELAAIPAGCMYYAALVREHPAAQPVPANQHIDPG